MKKKKGNRIALVFISIAPLLLMWGGLFFCLQGSGFSLDKISSKLSYNEEWEVHPLPREQIDSLRQDVFPQTYYYLGSGNQCYAFISEDRRFVFKFFKMQNLQIDTRLGKNPFAFLENFSGNKKQIESLSYERVFASYKEAFEELPEETGLLFVHLNKSRYLKTKVTLIDGRGKKYFVDLDTTEFVVQKKADKIFDCLAKLVEQESWDEAKRLVHSFFQVIGARAHKGFADQGLSIRNNFGFVDGKAVQFDCGTLTRDSSMKYPHNFRKEIMNVAERLDQWAHSYDPQMSLIIQEEAQAVINDLF